MRPATARSNRIAVSSWPLALGTEPHASGHTKHAPMVDAPAAVNGRIASPLRPSRARRAIETATARCRDARRHLAEIVGRYSPVPAAEIRIGPWPVKGRVSGTRRRPDNILGANTIGIFAFFAVRWGDRPGNTA